MKRLDSEPLIAMRIGNLGGNSSWDHLAFHFQGPTESNTENHGTFAEFLKRRGGKRWATVAHILSLRPVLPASTSGGLAVATKHKKQQTIEAVFFYLGITPQSSQEQPGAQSLAQFANAFFSRASENKL